MTFVKINGATITPEQNNLRRQKLGALLSSDPSSSEDNNDYDDFDTHRHFSRRSTDAAATATPRPNYTTAATFYSNPSSAASSPYNNSMMSPWSQASPYTKSPWIHQPAELSSTEYGESEKNMVPKHGLIGSLYREEGHVYSLAAAGNLLYTGSDSKNIRVWKNLQEFSGIKSSSGLLKAIVVFENKIFTGHQDGKIRVWRFFGDKKNIHKRVGSLPTARDLLMKSMNPKNYIEVRRHHNVPWVKHYDAVSCLSIDAEQGLLYSGSWDKTLKVWRLSDSKCLESIYAHDDALNSVAAFGGFVFTGSADGTVKAWRRELVGKATQHVLVETLLRQDHAVTSLVVSRSSSSSAALYAGSSDGLVSFWERAKHFMAFGGVLRGHKLAVLCLAAAGNLVMSGSADRSICVWRREFGGEHSCVAVLTGHSGPVKCLAVDDVDDATGEDDESENRQWILYSGSLDKSVKVWRVSDHAETAKESSEGE